MPSDHATSVTKIPSLTKSITLFYDNVFIHKATTVKNLFNCINCDYASGFQCDCPEIPR